MFPGNARSGHTSVKLARESRDFGALLGSVAEVVAEHAAEPMRASDSSGCIPIALQRFDQPVSQSLMVSLSVIQLDNEIPILP
jgi:hypothetical protein